MEKGPLPLNVHAAIEPLIAIVLIASPWIFGFSENDTATTSAIVIGALVLITGMSTDWRYSLVNLISIRTHMLMDIGVAAALLVAPFALDFDESGAATRFFVIAGVLELMAALATRWEHQEHRAARSAERV
jgi:SPW repeat